jgi:hypothetical protein
MTKETAKHVLAHKKSNYKQRDERRKELGITSKELHALKEQKKGREEDGQQQGWTIRKENIRDSVAME